MSMFSELTKENMQKHLIQDIDKAIEQEKEKDVNSKLIEGLLKAREIIKDYDIY